MEGSSSHCMHGPNLQEPRKAAMRCNSSPGCLLSTLQHEEEQRQQLHGLGVRRLPCAYAMMSVVRLRRSEAPCGFTASKLTYTHLDKMTVTT